MIKKIYLHIGLHKTATTTIQSTLYSERSRLAEAGILYPEFYMGEEPVNNHSIPFYSMFCGNPEEYHINVRKDITTEEDVKKLHSDYRKQIESQITNFHGETLVISGEDICLLSKTELMHLQSYLTGITQPDVFFRVILVCRHPVAWFKSVSQTFVKTRGITIENQLKSLKRQSHRFGNLIQTISEVFGQNCVSVLRFEDIVHHQYGPAGALMEIISEVNPEIIKPEITQENKSGNHETIQLLNAVIKIKSVDYKLKLRIMDRLGQYLSDMPGQKLMLSKGQSIKVWNILSDDANWLCNRYSLREYEFVNEDIQRDIDVWSKPALTYLENIFPEIPLIYKKMIVLEFLKKIISIRETLSLSKRQELLLFVLSVSKTVLLLKLNKMITFRANLARFI
ncbi:MAG: hypothetical protein ACKOCO_17130 [Bacteroidota bacterium]